MTYVTYHMCIHTHMNESRRWTRVGKERRQGSREMGEELKEEDGKNLQVHEILKGVCRKRDAVYNESTLIKI